MAELSLDEGLKEEQLAEGILAILSPAVQQVDGKIGDVRWGLGASLVAWQFEWSGHCTQLAIYYTVALSFRKSQAELKDKIDYLAEGILISCLR